MSHVASPAETLVIKHTVSLILLQLSCMTSIYITYMCRSSVSGKHPILILIFFFNTACHIRYSQLSVGLAADILSSLCGSCRG